MAIEKTPVASVPDNGATSRLQRLRQQRADTEARINNTRGPNPPTRQQEEALERYDQQIREAELALENSPVANSSAASSQPSSSSAQSLAALSSVASSAASQVKPKMKDDNAPEETNSSLENASLSQEKPTESEAPITNMSLANEAENTDSEAPITNLSLEGAALESDADVPVVDMATAANPGQLTSPTLSAETYGPEAPGSVAALQVGGSGATAVDDNSSFVTANPYLATAQATMDKYFERKNGTIGSSERSRARKYFKEELDSLTKKIGAAEVAGNKVLAEDLRLQRNALMSAGHSRGLSLPKEYGDALFFCSGRRSKCQDVNISLVAQVSSAMAEDLKGFQQTVARIKEIEKARPPTPDQEKEYQDLLSKKDSLLGKIKSRQDELARISKAVAISGVSNQSQSYTISTNTSNLITAIAVSANNATKSIVAGDQQGANQFIEAMRANSFADLADRHAVFGTIVHMEEVRYSSLQEAYEDGVSIAHYDSGTGLGPTYANNQPRNLFQ